MRTGRAGDDAGAPLGVGSEDAVIEELVGPWARDERGEALEQLLGAEP